MAPARCTTEVSTEGDVTAVAVGGYNYSPQDYAGVYNEGSVNAHAYADYGTAVARQSDLLIGYLGLISPSLKFVILRFC